MEVAGEEVANSWPAPVTPLCGVRVVVPGADMRTFARQETILGSPQLVKLKRFPSLTLAALSRIHMEGTEADPWGCDIYTQMGLEPYMTF